MTENTMIVLIEKYKAVQNSETQEKAALLEQAVSSLAEFLYTNLNKFKLEYITEDYRSDFIVAIYPRLKTIIQQYDKTKASFSTYLRWIIHLSYRTFTRNRYGDEAKQKVYEAEEGNRLKNLEKEQFFTTRSNSLLCEKKVAYTVDKKLNQAKKLSKKKQEIEARRIYLFACKAGCFLDERSICHISQLSGYNKSFLQEKLEYIRVESNRKIEKKQNLIELQNSFYIRTRKCLYEMKYLDAESARYHSLKKEYNYCLKKWNISRSNVLNLTLSPSNRFIALTLGISRGTIDSTLATLQKHRYSELS